jgi:hypothetical protein
VWRDQHLLRRSRSVIRLLPPARRRPPDFQSCHRFGWDCLMVPSMHQRKETIMQLAAKICCLEVGSDPTTREGEKRQEREICQLHLNWPGPFLKSRLSVWDLKLLLLLVQPSN